MIASPPPVHVRLSELFASIGFPDERGRAQRIATKFDVTRETARKWLAGHSLPETARLAEMVRGSPYSVDYILTGRQSQAPESTGAEVRSQDAVYNVPGQRLLARLSLALQGGYIDDRMIRVFNAMLDALMNPGK